LIDGGNLLMVAIDNKRNELLRRLCGRSILWVPVLQQFKNTNLLASLRMESSSITPGITGM